ncbi:MAG TPA: zinc ribbon domain-containing protein [Anaerolineae bacterium]|nr:zinc ribbon domain-containing protein [Anaerolineae bacterium]HOQ97922.1 zinc ribbon domain-containing protein [Anaerolineae bacterium]HPL29568.1 zinc ribbon domain-containing protein [Anaerolineae bacterium]
MPIFEYRCPRCGQVFEHWWRGRERREELRCPQCGEQHVEKLVSALGTRGSSAFGSAGSSCAPSGGG